MPVYPPINPEFGAGSSAALLVDARDETRLTHKIALKEMREIIKRTAFQSADFSEELSYGLLSALVNSEGYLSQDAATVQAQMATFIGRKRQKRFLMIAPSGFQLGNEAIFCETKASDFDVDVTLNGITTAAAGFATSQSGLIDGQVLHSPHGVPGGGGNEIMRMEWSGVNSNQFFALRAAGTAPLAARFQLSTYIAGGVVNTATLMAFLKAQIQELPAFAGRTVTFSVLNPFTLSAGVWSGTLQLAFDGTTNAADLEVVSGAVRRFQVVGGNAGNYSSDGGANFLLGITAANFQVNQAPIAGHGRVVCLGSSAAPGASFNVSGAPNAQFNGRYNQTNELAGVIQTLPAFKNANGMFLIPNFQASNGQNDHQFFYSLATPAQINAPIRPTEFTGTYNQTNWQQSTNTGLTPLSSVWNNGITLASGPVIAGTADFISYFPVDAAPAAPTSTGVGASHTTLIASNAIAANITFIVISQGGQNGLTYNLITASGQVAWVDSELASAKFDAMLSVLKLLGTGATLTVFIDHADDNGAGAPGAVTQALVFDAATASGVQFKRAVNAQIKRWRRVRWTLTGTNPIAVFAVAAAS